jgi:hypothetical protein
MWYEQLQPGRSWASLWSGYVMCGECGGIRTLDSKCPACGDPELSVTKIAMPMPDGTKQMTALPFMGAEGRYEDWIYLQLLEREWKRPVEASDQEVTNGLTARAAIVLVFWTYFETRIERLLQCSMQHISEPIAKDLLCRYNSIGSRLNKLYKLLFSLNYWEELEQLGFKDIAVLLKQVHEKRNEFVHGDPESIDDTLVTNLVKALQQEHESWIAAFNKRATRKQ